MGLGSGFGQSGLRSGVSQVSERFGIKLIDMNTIKWYFRIMAKNTSFILGDHFDEFVSDQVRSGRYANAADVIRSGLRLLEEHEQKVEALRRALVEGEESGVAGALDMEAIKRRARGENGRSAS